MRLHDCPRCGEYCVTGSHTCPPRYIVWSPDHGSTEEDGRAFRAHSARAAAEQWAAWDDSHSADYCIVRGSDAVVHVRSEDGGDVLVFRVSGETVPRYRAVDISPEQASTEMTEAT